MTSTYVTNVHIGIYYSIDEEQVLTQFLNIVLKRAARANDDVMDGLWLTRLLHNFTPMGFII